MEKRLPGLLALMPEDPQIALDVLPVLIEMGRKEDAASFFAKPYAMLRAAAAHGAVVRMRALVEQVLVDGGRARGVALRGGQKVEADWVVNCAGRWADTLAASDRMHRARD